MDVSSVEKQFKEKKSRIFLYFGIVLFFAILLITIFSYFNIANAATSPNIITYQGKLLINGVSVTTTQDIKYILYDDPTAGTALYSAAGTTSTPLAVSTTVSNGFFSIDLGDTGTNPIDPTIFKNNSAVYLKVIVGSETLSPRKRITASPYSLNSKYLDGVGASSTPQASTYIPISDSSGNFNFNGVTSTALNVSGNTTLATTTISSLTSVSSTFTNATTTGSFWTNLLTATTGWITNLFWTDATSTGNTYLNTLTTIGNTNLATTTISSSTIGYLNVSNNSIVGGTLSVTGNSSFGTITSGTWSGNIITNAKGGTGQDSSSWTGFTKVIGGTWSTSSISVNDLTNSTTLAYLSNSQTFTGQNIFSSTSTFAGAIFNGYIGVGTTTPSEKLHIYDGTLLVDSPVSPSLSGSYTTTSLGARSVYVSGKYAYILSTNGLAIIDVNNKSNPSTVGFAMVNGVGDVGDRAVMVAGKYAYAISNASSSLNVIDVSNPAAPTLVGSVVSTTALASAKSIAVSGHYAYVVANGNNGLAVVDISNPAIPTVVGFIKDNTQLLTPVSVYVNGKYAYVASKDGNSITILDISVATNPTVVGFKADNTYLNGSYSVYVSGRYAYVVSNFSNSFATVDVGDPTNPTIVGSLIDNTILNQAQGIFVSGKYAYVIGVVNDYFGVIDISSSTAPRMVGSYTSGSTNYPNSVFVSGKYAYVASIVSNNLAIIDIKGANISSADIGNIATNDLTVWENSDIGNDLFVRNAIVVGSGGINSGGALSIASNISSGNLFNISSSTNSSIFTISSNGSVGINTSTIGGSSYKLLIDAGSSSNGAIGVNGFIRATSYITGTTTLDLAETYPINMQCTANGTCPVDGDVVCIDPTVIAGVKKCSISEVNQMIGIVSANPGFLLGGGNFSDPSQNLGTVKVALAGRVPVKVSLVNGVINAGDKLTLSNINGVAAKAIGEVPVIGIAMENYSDNGTGSVLAFVNLGWQNQIYKALTIDVNTSTLTVGSSITPYNLSLSGEFTMFNDVLNKLVFNATALFETKSNSSHAFIFNATNFDSAPDKYLLSLRSNNEPKFSVMANGDVRAAGNLYAVSAVFGTSSNPGDLAERVDIASDDIVEPGDVLVVDMNNTDTYRRSSASNEQAVAGVVSTNPTIVVGNGKTEYTAVMAMVGRVPLKVSDENGQIARGDLLVTASSSGYAMKYDPKKDSDNKMIGVVGVALDPFNGGKGKIMALVRTGWVNSRYETITSIKENLQQLATSQGIVLGATSTTNLNVVSNNNGQLAYTGGDLNLQGNTLLNVASIVGKNNRWLIDEFGHFITKLNTSQGDKDMYAIQSPISEFVFSSSSQLIAGEAIISFDQSMQDIIDFAQPLKINITLTSGEAKGIFVSEKNIHGFSVKELDSGVSNASFDWMVVAKRKDQTVEMPIVENLIQEVLNTTTETLPISTDTSSVPAIPVVEEPTISTTTSSPSSPTNLPEEIIAGGGAEPATSPVENIVSNPTPALVPDPTPLTAPAIAPVEITPAI